MATAAGLVLGVLPLVVEVAKHYKTVRRLYGRYKNCGPEFAEFQRRLQVEQTAFCNEIQILLASLTNFDTANKLLEEDHHALLSESGIIDKFSQHLGASEQTCLGIIGTIDLKLSMMDKYIEGKMPTESDRDFFVRIKRKLKFSFSESLLEARLAELSKLNADFMRVSGQINRLKNLQTDSVPSTMVPRKLKRIQQYEAVRRAALQLFDALGKACDIHPEHWAQIQLDPQHVNLNDGEPPLVKFIMAFTQSVMMDTTAEAETTTDCAPIWVSIESILSESMSNEPLEYQKEVKTALSNLKMTLKRVNDAPPQMPLKKQKTKKNVSFLLPQPDENKDVIKTLTAHEIAPVISAEALLPDFSRDRDFCIHVQRLSPCAAVDTGSCIGYLRKTSSCKQRVLRTPTTFANEKKSITLARLIEVASSRKYGGRFLQYESLRLARQLASAVLQFHATPILQGTWRSKDVVFFGIDESSRTLVAPHLNVLVRIRDESGISIATRVCEKTHHKALARNPYLFGLGIVLIELAYQAPFSSLKEEVDLMDGQEDFYTDFRAADRLSEGIGKELGSTYGRIVRRCLFCNFGEDSKELSDPALQTAFHRDVLCELEILEARVKKFQIGD